MDKGNDDTIHEGFQDLFVGEEDGLIDRESWKGKRVILWAVNRSTKLGNGVVLLVHPYEAINCSELGESSLGVIVEGSLHPAKSDNSSLNLVSWPISQLTFENGESLIKDTGSSSTIEGIEDLVLEEMGHPLDNLDASSDEYEDDDTYINIENSFEEDTTGRGLGLPIHTQSDREKDATASEYDIIDGTTKKRSYVHRVRPRKKIGKAHAFSKRCDVANIHKVATVDCCEKRCCQIGDRSKILQARADFWGQSYNSRSTFVLDCMNMAYRQDQNEECFDFTFDGKKVCNKAWYVMHGIGKSTFYRLRNKFLDGACSGNHGNSGIIRKSMTHVEMAKSLIQGFIDNNADQMPHKSRTTMHGTRETQRVLPSMYKQVDILREVNDTLITLGYKTLSQPTFSRLWSTVFKTVTLSKTSTFSKCDICTSIKVKLESTKNQVERARYMAQRRAHMLQQMSCRNLYYAWRSSSEMNPTKFLCIIHDKMDQSKTAIPHIKPVPKSLNGVERLPVSLTGMLTHGHGQTAYGHFALGLWPSDPNFTIASLSKCLRNLERRDKHRFGDLSSENSNAEQRTHCFEAVLSTTALYHHMEVLKEKNQYCKQQNAQNEEAETDLIRNVDGENNVSPQGDDCQRMQSILPTNASIQEEGNAVGFTKLPRTLLLQLDNCGSENKNRYVFAYLSLLVARGVFDTVQLGFLMVGHTHEDIDALFSRFSEKLRKQSIFTFPHLMKIFNECVNMHPAPFLLQKMADFKGFVKGCLHDGADSLMGHSKPLQFRFYMSDGIPLMQYKVHPKNVDWLPEKGIELWKRNDQGRPKLPEGVPKVLPPFEYVKDSENVVEGLKKYVSWWKEHLQEKGDQSEYARWINPVLVYWENLMQAMQNPSVREDTSFDDFWPRSICEPAHPLDLPLEDTIDAGLDVNEGHYCGPMRDKPAREFNPTLDVAKGDFVLVQPCDAIYPIWLGVTTTDVDQDNESANYLQVKIQYWAPISKKKNASDVEVYKDCWNKYWRENINDPQRWEDTSCIIWAWKPKGGKIPEKIKIPKAIILKAKESQMKLDEHEAPSNVTPADVADAATTNEEE